MVLRLVSPAGVRGTQDDVIDSAPLDGTLIFTVAIEPGDIGFFADDCGSWTEAAPSS
jgi:hypothetical protein